MQDTWRILNELFADRAPSQRLMALAILCQGFLTVQARKEFDGKWGPHEIRKALEQMGWPDFMGKLEGIKDPALELLTSTLIKQRPEVCKPSWWSSILGESKSEFEMHVAYEWGVNHIGDCPELKLLVDTIYSTDSTVASATVANAYCVMTKKLGGKPCKQW